MYVSKVDGKFLFSPVSVNFLTEFMKVVFAIGMLLWQVSKLFDIRLKHAVVCRLANEAASLSITRVNVVLNFFL